jgi:hypothetical protein
MIPMAVASAFCCELYLKCLIRLEGKKPDSTHDLEILFGTLNSESQESIRKASEPDVTAWVAWFDEVYHKHLNKEPPKVDFDFLLNRSADAFKKIRYQFEKLENTTTRNIDEHEGWLGGGITWAIRGHIISLQPQWATLHLILVMRSAEPKHQR